MKITLTNECLQYFIFPWLQLVTHFIGVIVLKMESIVLSFLWYQRPEKPAKYLGRYFRYSSVFLVLSQLIQAASFNEGRFAW